MDASNQDILEEFVDSYGLAEVLLALDAICCEKACHLEANWQDKDAAKAWVNAGLKIQQLANKMEDF